MSKKKIAFIQSLIALILCASMFVGTTFAWFTDEVTSTGNIIQSGSLEAGLLWHDEDETEWKDASNGTIFNYAYWEPGYTQTKYVKITNEGNLAFEFRLDVIPEKPFDADGVNLADVIDVYLFEASEEVTREAVAAATPVGTLTELMADADGAAHGYLLPENGAKTATDGEPVGEIEYCIVLKMQESAGNEYQDRYVGSANGFVVRLLATQYTWEEDSFGNNYDTNAEYDPSALPNTPISESVTGAVTVDEATNTVAETVALTGATASAEIPAGVKLADGVAELTFSVTSMEETNADVNTTSRDEILRSIDVHVEGVAEDNTVPMTFVVNELFPAALNSTSVKLYHVEGTETKEMTLVDTPVNHNEFSYDPLTGDVVVTIKSFSEIAAYADTYDAWDGITVATKFSDGDGSETNPYLIANAAEFAYFRNEVDSGRSFEREYIQLCGDINLGGHNFDPIGWGYDNQEWNANGAVGKVFKGTFDGNEKTIYGLYQSGWSLESSTGTDYTYTNCGGGLFASALDATFKDLTIDGAQITFECVEIGVLVGLAQGSCTFENITIAGCKIANYQRPAGGVVGEVSPKIENDSAVEGTHTFNNVYVDSNTVVGSLWGDFDTPVGGVIGAYWDDTGATSVSMSKVTVACELDVYNDVTSTYQWYAYRRAGMLVGNSDRSTGHTATADYLACAEVTVYYDAWADYHYCEFNEANPNWPWVRVEPGENCEGYSNPRWGRPIDSTTGQPVTDSVHEHGEGEGHLQSITFHQLYGGGQGVYGAEKHDNVDEGIYTVTYMDRGEVLHVDYVTDNSVAYDSGDIWPIANAAVNGEIPTKWVDANSSDFTGVNAGNTANVIVYPKWPNEYTIRCLDTYGDVAYYNFATDDNTTDAEYEEMADEINNTLLAIQNEVDASKKVMIIKWEDADGTLYETITANNIKASVSAGEDFILEAVPQLQTTSITLEKYYDPITGELVAYHVTEVAQGDDNTSVVIPDYVGNIPVTVISEGAAEGFENLHAVTIPGTIENIGDNAFASTPTINRLGIPNLETQTFYYEGDSVTFNEQLQEHLDDGESAMLSKLWDSGLGEGSRIFFLANGKVNPEAGYWELTEAKIEKSGNILSGYELTSEEYVWEYYSSVSSDFTEEYTGDCDCGCGTRPDESYWTDVFTTTAE